jgi:SAM-dependent methyltransferase
MIYELGSSGILPPKIEKYQVGILIVGQCKVIGVPVIVMSKMLRQCRKPTGWLGRQVARGMNISHSKLTDWGLKHVSIGKGFTILDIGCGGGGTISKLASIAKEGKVCGIDYSDDSVSISQKRNKKLMEAGRVEIRQGSVSNMPFADGMFDLVSAIETHYFWPNLAVDMKEVLRVLKAGGEFILLGGEYSGGKFDKRNAKWVKLGNITYHTADGLRQLFSDAGFADVAVIEEYERGWICAMGKK